MKNEDTIIFVFAVEGMTCASCAANLENFLRQQVEIKSVSVDYTNRSTEITMSTDAAQKIKKKVEKIGFKLKEKELSQSSQYEKKRLDQLKNRLIISVLFTIPIFILAMFSVIPNSAHIQLILALPVILYSGKEFYISAFRQVKSGMSNMDTLVALSTGIAFISSIFNTFYPQFLIQRGMSVHVYYESATVILSFILIGKYLEESAKIKTSFATRKLLKLQPNTITVLEDNKSVCKPMNQVKTNDVVMIKSGERISVDGCIIEGQSIVDESMLSGEPLPIRKKVGDQVRAGTMNQLGTIQVHAKKVGNQTLLAHIIRRVEQAQASKPPIQKLVDRIARVFVPVILILALLTFLVWFYFGNFTYAFSNFISVLIIACPCALGLATPTAITVGIGRGAMEGILIKDTEQLQKIAQINAIVFDKTGTITEGKPKVTNCTFTDDKHHPFYHKIMYMLESRSEHPLATAITSFLQGQLSDQDLESINQYAVSDFNNVLGKGICLKVNSKMYFMGHQNFISEQQIPVSEILKKQIERSEKQGKTVVLASDETEIFASITLEDCIKDMAYQVIKQFNANNIETYLLTGDHAESAHQVAQEIGIKNYVAQALPHEKGTFIQKLQQEGKVVAMIGDGINDSEALARADVGIALANGSDIALESAGLVLLHNHLHGILFAKKLSAHVLNTIRQNLFWAFIYNILAIPIAMGILYPFTGFLLNPMIGGLAMAFSSVSVVMNSLRLRHFRL